MWNGERNRRSPSREFQNETVKVWKGRLVLETRESFSSDDSVEFYLDSVGCLWVENHRHYERNISSGRIDNRQKQEDGRMAYSMLPEVCGTMHIVRREMQT